MKSLTKLWSEFELHVDNTIVGNSTRLRIAGLWLVSGLGFVLMSLHIFVTCALEYPIWVKFLTFFLASPGIVFEWLVFWYAGDRWTSNFCLDTKKWSRND